MKIKLTFHSEANMKMFIFISRIMVQQRWSKPFQQLGNYPLRCSAAKGAELDSAAAKQKAPFAAVWREAGAYII